MHTRKRAWTAVWGIAAAAAAVLIVAVGHYRFSGQVAATGPYLRGVNGEVSLWRGGERQAESPRPGLVLAAKDQLRTAATARVQLVLVDEALVETTGATTLQVAQGGDNVGSTDECVELGEGRVALQVPKLAPGHTLCVRTVNTKVTVRGTRFSVAVDPKSVEPRVTHVAVSEGRVEVLHDGHTLFLSAGEDWSSPGQPPAPQAAQQSDSAASPVTSLAPSLPRSPRHESRAASSPLSHKAQLESTLAEENTILEHAMQSARSGDTGRALSDLDSLSREHPRSPLVQSALVEHFRLLHQMGNQVAAAREARRYLSDYPNGFARSEAKQIALFGLADSP